MNYTERIWKANTHLQRGGVYSVEVAHDDNCRIYSGGNCTCVPDITISGEGQVLTVDEHGSITKRSKS